jgi:hypothetical protein
MYLNEHFLKYIWSNLIKYVDVNIMLNVLVGKKKLACNQFTFWRGGMKMAIFCDFFPCRM